MPVIVLEARDFASPLFLVRTWALLSGCLTFSLVASLKPSELQGPPPDHLATFRNSCMFTWCLFFILTFLIHVLNVIQFHNLIPISWKNLTVTVAALGALMCLSASMVFPWILMDHTHVSPRPVAAAVASCLTFLAYTFEVYIICTQAQEQRGYMASKPGLLKVVQFWGGCQMIPLVVEGVQRASASGDGGLLSELPQWQLWLSGVLYILCVLMSLGTVIVILGDCAGRCPLPFDRLFAGFSLFGALLYIVATVICFTKLLQLRNLGHNFDSQGSELVIMETVIASITLLAYTVDLTFSIKLLHDRNHA